jgi:hypothetical protein
MQWEETAGIGMVCHVYHEFKPEDPGPNCRRVLDLSNGIGAGSRQSVSYQRIR